jgi:hypothetical protein
LVDDGELANKVSLSEDRQRSFESGGRQTENTHLAIQNNGQRMAQVALRKNDLTFGILTQSQILTEGNQFLICQMST